MVRKVFPLVLVAVLILSLFPAPPGLAGPPVPVTPQPFPFSDVYPAEVVLATPEMYTALIDSRVDIGDIRTQDPNQAFPRQDEPFVPLVATVYINEGEAARLADQGLIAQPIPNSSVPAYPGGPTVCSSWPSYTTLVTRMQNLVNAHPDIMRMYSIGQSVQGRDLWVLKITDNPDVQEDEPEFRYSSTHHGNEAVGTEMILRLAEQLANTYGSDPRITNLVDNVEIWLWPLYNPDGYEACSRGNGHGVDLNRDFPDRFTDPVDDPTGREPETQASMAFSQAHTIVMGANFHTGACVVNYPWDAISPPEATGIQPDISPDNAVYYAYSVGFAARNPDILNGGFDDGVTEGYQWYSVYGGMQDYLYVWHAEHHVTIENSFGQPPAYSEMNTYWSHNQEAMLWWMERVLTGARGLVTDANTSAPLAASVDATEIGKPIYTDPDIGDYHHLFLPGTYHLVASAYCYEPMTATVTVGSGNATIQDFPLVPSGNYTVDGTVTDVNTGLPLAATIEIEGAPISTTTDPGTGHYSLQLCAGSYTMRVSAPGHRPAERDIVVSGDQTQDFQLEPTACTLLVDDDTGANYQTWYENALTAIGEDYDLWTVSSQGSPTAADLAGYGRVIWETGDDYGSTLTSADEAALSTYLDGGGKLLVSGQDLGYDIHTDPFYANYLHASYVDDDSGDTSLTGQDIFAGLSIDIAGGDGANNQDYPDVINAANGSTAVFQYSANTYGAVAYSNATYAVVYLGFGFEGISTQANRNEVMTRALDYLGGCDSWSYGVAAGSSTAWGAPGETVTHLIAVTNTGSVSDSYDVAITPGSWPATLLDPQVGPLDPGESATARVQVDIPQQPLSVSLVVSDVVGAHVTSVAAPNVGAQATATTYTGVALDLALSADTTQQPGVGGQSLTYTLFLTNTGAYTDSYTFSLAGNAWPTQVAPTQVGPLGPGEAAQAAVRVDLPAGPGGESDVVTVRATSDLADPLYAEQVLTSTRLGAGVTVGDSSALGAPGETVTHTVLITNTGTTADSYDLAVTPGTWPAVLLDTQVGPLEPGQSATARVRVDIPRQPFSASLVVSDVLTVEATSVAAPDVSAQGLATTYAESFLDLALAADQSSRTGVGGQPLTYTLFLTNTGAYTDSYTFSLSGNAWPTQVTPTQVGPLGPGETAQATVRVDLPVGPGALTDVVTVRATSDWVGQLLAEQALTSTRLWGGVIVGDSTAAGMPGEVVTHTLSILNASEVDDTYTVALTPGAWPTTLLDEQVGPLAPGERGHAHVLVEIPRMPLTATTLVSDVFTVQVTSTVDPGVGDQGRGTTYAVADLDVALRAEPAGQVGLPGQVVTYTLFVTNSGSYTDGYSVSLSGNAWPAEAVPVQTAPLGPGETAQLELRVTVPAGPGGEADAVLVTVISGLNDGVQASVAVTTTRGWSTCLPVVVK